MPNKPKSAKRAQPGSNEVKWHIAAHAAALKKSAAASDKLTAAVKAHAAAVKAHANSSDELIAALDAHATTVDKANHVQAALTGAISRVGFAVDGPRPAPSDDDKTTDARACVRSWLVNSKHISSAKAGNPATKLADIQMSTVDLGSCLTAVQECLQGTGKGYQFMPDLSNSNLNKLLAGSSGGNGTVGDVVAYVASNIKP
jgi:hypothetical protein